MKCLSVVWRRWVASLLLVCLSIVSASSSALAAESVLPAEVQANRQLAEKLTAQFDPYVAYQNGRYVLTAVPEDASAEEVSMVRQQIARSNALVLQFREIAAKSQGKVQHKEGSIGTLVFGEDKIVYYWNGLDWYLSHTTTEQIVYALNMGQGIMAILAILVVFIPPHGPAAAVALAIAIALFQMGADTLDYFDKGRGVIVEVRYGFVTGVKSQ